MVRRRYMQESDLRLGGMRGGVGGLARVMNGGAMVCGLRQYRERMGWDWGK